MDFNDELCHDIIFTDKQGTEVGRLIFEKDVMSFKGKADQSAALFIESCKEYWKTDGQKFCG